MSATTLVGPSDQMQLPHQSLGIIFYNGIKAKDPNHVILNDNASGEDVTYGTLLKLSIKLATELRKLGVGKGDIITIVSQNHWKYLLTIIACLYIGATVNYLNPDYTSGELKHLLSICRPVLIFCTSKSLENILKLKNESFIPQKIVIYDAETSDEARNFDTLLEGSEDVNFKPVELDPEEETAFIMTSSGTTGFPKCVMLTHANYRLTMTYAVDPLSLDLNPQESTMAFLPFFHILGNCVALGSILHGAKLVVLDKFVPDRFLQAIRDHKITKLFAVPPILLFLVKSPLVEKYDVSSIQDILCGGALVPKELEEMVEERLKVKSVRQVFGMTEASGAATILPKNVKKYGTVGKVTVSFKIKVCDVDSGKALPPNQIGELRMFGDGVMKGYLGNDEESKTTFDDEGFLRSGDLGYYDEEGFFYIVDRLKEIIKYKGFQVSPAELESLLIQHPAVKDAGIVGIPDERAGEVPLAFIVKQPNKNVSEGELVRYIEENVSVQKRLYGGVRFVEEIPKNASGKILRWKLKELV